MPTTVADYLLDRLADLDVEHIFGVPGDYTLGLLDHVIAHERVAWVGTTNELNAGYAADGYGRARGIGALMTTFGVGELSAINAVTGSFAEHVPVIHIVGSPSTGTQSGQRIVHHSLGDGVFTHFLQMHAPITCARATLTPANAAAEIDRVLSTVRDSHQPGYLLLPADVGETEIAAAADPLPQPEDPTDPDALDAFTRAAQRLLERAGELSRVTVLGGVMVHRTGAYPELWRLIDSGPLTHATSPWAKSLVDENNDRYVGIYAGAASAPAVRAAVEDSAALIIAGVQFTDLNSGFFSQQIDRLRTVELGATVASVGAAQFAPVSMSRALGALTQIVSRLASATAPSPPATAKLQAPVPSAHATGQPQAPPPVPPADEPLNQVELWRAVTRFLAPDDIVVADQGTSFFGMATQRLPERILFLAQPLWASIGYSLPALLGACKAAPHRHGVLLVGDGAAQMTVQELSTLARERISATVILVDNDGYTIERAIHGPQERYNDIARWDWSALMTAMAPGDPNVTTRHVGTAAELTAALDDARAFAGLTLIEAVVPQMDVPPLLSLIAREAGQANRRSG
jgi:TPP-dependent 2-oxoacid decarboxylase